MRSNVLKMFWNLASSKTACFVLIALFAAVLFHSAWLCDDAFISFRTADNFVHGFGLTWNVGERVQAYTHPLWLLLFSAVYSVTREPSFTAAFLSMAVSVAAVALLCWKVAKPGAVGALAVLALTYSVAFVDYSTSGLENPLSHLILAAFLWAYLRGNASARLLTFLAALAAVNRLDMALLYLPALVQTFWTHRSWRCLGSMAVGSLPLLLWLGFSLLYYGFLLPNTAFAKLNNGVPLLSLMVQGCYYLWNSVRTDPVTFAIIATGLACACWRREPRQLCIAAGIVLYLLYIVRIGGDFMSGRLLTSPLLAAVGVLASVPWKISRVWAATAAVTLLGLLSVRPLSVSVAGLTPSNGEKWGEVVAHRGVCDERAFYFAATGVRQSLGSGGGVLLSTGRVQAAKQLAALAELRGKRLVLCAEFVGIEGFYAGPRVHLVDLLALADPLLASLPPRPDPCWRIGHFRRPQLAGYLETIRSGKNVLGDPGLAEYYDHLRLITHGSLWDPRRLATIWNINIGRYNRLLEPTAREILATPSTEFNLMLDPGQTLSKLGQAIAKDPRSPLNYLCRASLLRKSGRLIEAMADLDRAIQLDPGNAAGHVGRGEILAQQNQREAAILAFRQAITLKPSSSDAWRCLAQCHMACGRWDLAAEELRRATEADPDDLESHYGRSVCWARAGQHRRAIEEATAVVTIAPDQAIGYSLLAATLAGAKDIKPIEHVPIESPGELSGAIGRLAWVLATAPDATLRNGDDAVSYAKLALAFFPWKRIPELVDVLAAAYAEAGRFADASVAAREAIELAVAAKRHELAEQIEGRLRLYEAGTKYRAARP